MADVKLGAGSPWAVAYDLMLVIAKQEAPSAKGRDSREYWLKLYAECLDKVGAMGVPRS